MNTKVLFYCTHIHRDGFTKLFFETITDEPIESLDDAIEWMDDNVSYHYNLFDLDTVIDWFLILHEPTNDNVKETEIIKTVIGHLFFEDTIEYQYYRIGKAEMETKAIKTQTKVIKKENEKLKKEAKVKKYYESCWIENSGEIHYVNFAEHNEFASDWLEENDYPTWHRITNSIGRYYYEVLQDFGWIRILGWTDPPSFVIPKRITPKQKNALRDYCTGQKLKYEHFPDILKT